MSSIATTLRIGPYYTKNTDYMCRPYLFRRYTGLSLSPDAARFARGSKYKGKRMRVDGTVDSIRKDAVDSIVVSLGSGKQFEVHKAQCYFGKDSTERVSSLSKGDSISVECTGGGMVLTAVNLKNCTMASP